MSERSHEDMQDLTARLDAALDALNAERAPLLPPADDQELLELIDTARLVRQLRDPALPAPDYPQRLAAALAADLRSAPPGHTFSSNGHGALHPLPRSRRWARTRTAAALLAALLRAITVAVLAGMLAGVVVGGLGSRLAMYVAGQAFVREHPEETIITESSGRVVGSFSWSGTFDLLTEGMLFGIVGGIVLLLVRPWLARLGRRWEGLAFGTVLLIGAGTTVITGDNRDFARIGLPWLNILMFAALFLAFGPLTVALVRRLDRRLPTVSFRRPWRTGHVLGSLLILAVGGFWLVPLTLTMLAATVNVLVTVPSALLTEPLGDALAPMLTALGLFVLAAILPLVRLAGAPQLAPYRAKRHVFATLAGPRVQRAVAWLLVLVLGVGGVLTLVAIVRILAD